jgi:hypothetical protein
MEIQQATGNTAGMCACWRCAEQDGVQVHGAVLNGSVLNAPWLGSAKIWVLANNPMICSEGFFLSFSTTTQRSAGVSEAETTGHWLGEN